VRIIINIDKQEQAEKFLGWVQNRGDFLLGNMSDVIYWSEHPDEPAIPEIYINDAAEMSELRNDKSGNHSRDSTIGSSVGYSKLGPY
jgi:hypothetical protein